MGNLPKSLSDVDRHKLQILNGHLPERSASAVFAKYLATAVSDGVLCQVDPREPVYNLPYGRAYTGLKNRGDDYLYWYSTYDGCRDWWLKDGLLHIRIWDGDSVDGDRERVRGVWSFDLVEGQSLPRPLRDPILVSPSQEWTRLLNKHFREEEEAREKKRVSRALEEIESRLLRSSPDPT